MWKTSNYTCQPQGSKVAQSLLFRNARDEKQHSFSSVPRTWNLAISSSLKVFGEGMGLNMICMNCPWNVSQWIEIKQWFHANVRIVFHTWLEHALLNIKLPTIKQRCNYKSWLITPQHIWFTISSFQYFQVFGKLALTIKYNQYCAYTMPMASNKAH